MKKIVTYCSTNYQHKVPYDRVARIYESEEPVFKGCHFEVALNSGGVGVDWGFRPFRTLEDAQQYALQFIAPSHLLCKIRPE